MQLEPTSTAMTKTIASSSPLPLTLLSITGAIPNKSPIRGTVTKAAAPLRTRRNPSGFDDVRSDGAGSAEGNYYPCGRSVDPQNGQDPKIQGRLGRSSGCKDHRECWCSGAIIGAATGA
jgi:hypothetical protein